MEQQKDERLNNPGQPDKGERKPMAPTSTTADNPSVYHQPPVEEATTDGTAEKMDNASTEDRKHTP